MYLFEIAGCQTFPNQWSHHLIFFFYFGYQSARSIDCSSKGSCCCSTTYLSFHFSKESQKSPQRRSFGSKFLNGIRFSFLNPLNNLTPCRDVVKFFFEPHIAVIPKCVYYPTQEIMSCFYDSLCRPLHNLIIK